jgi:hypothetical protein
MNARFHISSENFERLLARTDENNRLYAILKNGVFIKGKMNILCNAADAEILLAAMRPVCPDEAVIHPV